MWDLNIKFCPKFRLICIAQNYAHLCKYIIFKNNNFFSKYMYFVIITIKPRLPETSLIKYMYYTVIVFNKGTCLRNYDHIAEYLLVAIIISLYFQKTDISFTYLVCTCTYLCQWPFTIRNICISLLLC